jgi:hypothetical protein
LDNSGNITGRNVYGTNLLMRASDGVNFNYLYNGHGDVVCLINADSGILRATYDYDAFGNVNSENYYVEDGNSVSPYSNSIGYSGYWYDRETGLYYLNSRCMIQRWPGSCRRIHYTGDPSDPLSLNIIHLLPQ